MMSINSSPSVFEVKLTDGGVSLVCPKSKLSRDFSFGLESREGSINFRVNSYAHYDLRWTEDDVLLRVRLIGQDEWQICNPSVRMNLIQEALLAAEVLSIIPYRSKQQSFLAQNEL